MNSNIKQLKVISSEKHGDLTFIKYDNGRFAIDNARGSIETFDPQKYDIWLKKLNEAKHNN